MRKFMISAAVAAAATMVAAPAIAQPRGHDRYEQRDRSDRRDRADHRDRDWDRRGPDRRAVSQLLRDLDQVENRIQRSVQRRAISPREAQSLRREAANIRQRIHQRARNGLSGREFAQLRQRVNRLRQRLRHERRDNDGRRW